MTDIRFRYVKATEIGPYVASLRRLEESIHYPLGDGADHFFIDHGPEYHPFFSGLGEARFLLALRGDEVVGSIAGVSREVDRSGRKCRALYLCDLKVAASERGKGLARRMLVRGLPLLLEKPELRRSRLIYGAGMRGAKGDVMRTARGFHPFKLGRPMASLAIYFASPSAVARLSLAGAPAAPTTPGLVLGPEHPQSFIERGWLTTAGRKDLRLLSTGKGWPLAHLPLGPAYWTPNLGTYLRGCAENVLSAGSDAQLCFAIDEQLPEQIRWLADQGVNPGASCSVYGLSLVPGGPAPQWVHLPTSEI